MFCIEAANVQSKNSKPETRHWHEGTGIIGKKTKKVLGTQKSNTPKDGGEKKIALYPECACSESLSGANEFYGTKNVKPPRTDE